MSNSSRDEERVLIRTGAGAAAFGLPTEIEWSTTRENIIMATPSDGNNSSDNVNDSVVPVDGTCTELDIRPSSMEEALVEQKGRQAPSITPPAATTARAPSRNSASDPLTVMFQHIQNVFSQTPVDQEGQLQRQQEQQEHRKRKRQQEQERHDQDLKETTSTETKVPLFIQRLWTIVNNPDHKNVSWSPTGEFIVILPAVGTKSEQEWLYRALLSYGFELVLCDTSVRWYSHDHFHRDSSDLVPLFAASSGAAAAAQQEKAADRTIIGVDDETPVNVRKNSASTTPGSAKEVTTSTATVKIGCPTEHKPLQNSTTTVPSTLQALTIVSPQKNRKQSNAISPFVLQLWEYVNNPSHSISGLVAWTPDGNAIVVQKKLRLLNSLKNHDFQLVRMILRNKFVFSHPSFRKDRPLLLSNIKEARTARLDKNFHKDGDSILEGTDSGISFALGNPARTIDVPLPTLRNVENALVNRQSKEGDGYATDPKRVVGPKARKKYDITGQPKANLGIDECLIPTSPESQLRLEQKNASHGHSWARRGARGESCRPEHRQHFPRREIAEGWSPESNHLADDEAGRDIPVLGDSNPRNWSSKLDDTKKTVVVDGDSAVILRVGREMKNDSCETTSTDIFPVDIHDEKGEEVANPTFDEPTFVHKLRIWANDPDEENGFVWSPNGTGIIIDMDKVHLKIPKKYLIEGLSRFVFKGKRYRKMPSVREYTHMYFSKHRRWMMTTKKKRPNTSLFVLDLWDLVNDPDNKTFFWSPDGNSVHVLSDPLDPHEMKRLRNHLWHYGYQLAHDKGASIKCYSHPHFRRGHPEELVKVKTGTRKREGRSRGALLANTVEGVPRISDEPSDQVTCRSDPNMSVRAATEAARKDSITSRADLQTKESFFLPECPDKDASDSDEEESIII